MPPEIVSRWTAVYLVDGDRVERAEPLATAPEARRAAIALRREGRRLPEEDRLLASALETRLVTRDRRLLGERVTLLPGLRRAPSVALPRPERAEQRRLLLDAAEAALADAWDPSVHVEEAVRAMSDLDEVLNRVGERLANWARHDAPTASRRGRGSPCGAPRTP